MNDFYRMDINEVKQSVEQDSTEKNALVEVKRKNVLQVFLEQFKDFLVIILIFAAIVSGFMGDVESSVVIVVVITMNAIIGTVQTRKAESTLNRLKELTVPDAKVMRDGTLITIPSVQVQIGDEVHLEAGDMIPADGRIITAVNLKVDESALTGESEPVEKFEHTINEEVPLADRKNMLYSGNFVTYGRGSFLVTNVGMTTEIGKIASMLQSASIQKTPLQVKLNEFGRSLSIIILIFCAIIFGVDVFQGQSMGDSFMFAVALAVAAIPEALSSIVTIVLAFGTAKMVDQHVIMRKLHAVEGLGSVSVICSDKTGTLTQNKMTVQKYFVNGKIYPVNEMNMNEKIHRLLVKASILCNDAIVQKEHEIGDPTEVAMVAVGSILDISPEEERKKYERKDEIPFDSNRKLMSTVHDIEEERYMIVKGAFDMMLPKINEIYLEDGIHRFDTEWKDKLEDVTKELSNEGLRVLSVGYKKITHNNSVQEEDEQELIFIGFVAMMDPPREEAKDAVASCKSAGIKTVMITGDHKGTAAAIAKKVGILEDEKEACEGKELDSLSDVQLEELVKQVSVYARVSPEHKIRIVKAWQKQGAIVAMTGDGVNDAPALKQADIGIAMGMTGSEVTKDAADMVLTDDNFATIEIAVENGRNIYENIKKSIQFLLSGNFAGILVVLAAALCFLPVPFEPVHLLFINLLTDSLPAIALGLEPHRKEVMNEKPRQKDEALLNPSMLGKIASEGLILSIVTMAGFLLGNHINGPVLGRTMAFGVLCLSRLFHGFSCESNECIFDNKGRGKNKYLIGAFLIGACLVTGVLMLPVFETWFRVESLTMNNILIVYGLVIAGFALVQLKKKIVSVLGK